MSQLIQDGHRADVEHVRTTANGEYSCGYVRLYKGFHVSELTSGRPFMGMMYGAGDRESYAFPAGMQLKNECNNGHGPSPRYTQEYANAIKRVEELSRPSVSPQPKLTPPPPKPSPSTKASTPSTPSTPKPQESTTEKPEKFLVELRNSCDCDNQPGPCRCRQRGAVVPRGAASPVNPTDCKSNLILKS